jgi:hypothetical protein
MRSGRQTAVQERLQPAAPTSTAVIDSAEVGG